jgi:flagellar assembly factor FliW
MKVKTKALGEIELFEEQIIEMPSGMIGFPDLNRYALVAFDDPEVPFIYWQNIDEPSLCFVLIDPALLFPDYEVVLTADELKDIELKSAEDGSVYVVITIPSDPQEMTANLMGPLIVNRSARKAKQLVLSDPRYTTKHLIIKREAPGHACANSENK